MTTLLAWKHFRVHVPESQREYRTIEVYHPQLDRVYRFVRNTLDVTLVLEDGAPRHENQSVVFTGSTLDIREPAEREDSEQSLSVGFGNVDGTIHKIIDQISGAGFFNPVHIVYRKYYSGDLAQPAVAPLYLYASSVGFNGPTGVSFTAEDTDLSQKRSGELYTVEKYPGLRE